MSATDVIDALSRRLADGDLDGAPIELAGVSSDVMRRQRDGSWRILVDDPWGA